MLKLQLSKGRSERLKVPPFCEMKDFIQRLFVCQTILFIAAKLINFQRIFIFFESYTDCALRDWLRYILSNLYMFAKNRITKTQKISRRIQGFFDNKFINFTSNFIITDCAQFTKLFTIFIECYYSLFKDFLQFFITPCNYLILDFIISKTSLL